MNSMLIVAFFLASSASWATSIENSRTGCGPPYAALYTQSAKSFTVAKIRYGLLEKLEKPLEFFVSGQKYTASHILGSSSATAYLGKNSAGKLVVIKKFPNSRNPKENFWKKVAMQEAAKTKIMAALGENTPQVLAADLQNGILVKEYSSGLQLKEIRANQNKLGLNEKSITELAQSLENEITRLEKQNPAVAKGVSDLKKNTEDPILGNLSDVPIYPLDLKENNFIYDFKQGKWILFDP